MNRTASSGSTRTSLGPSPPPSSAAVSKVMRANKARDTVPELLLRRALRGAGLPGYVVSPRGLPGRPDVAFRRAKVAIFVHGCFWHRCPHCRPALPKSNRSFWYKKFRLNVARDKRKAQGLRGDGWVVLTFWECKVRASPETAAWKVAAFLRDHSRL